MLTQLPINDGFKRVLRSYSIHKTINDSRWEVWPSIVLYMRFTNGGSVVSSSRSVRASSATIPPSLLCPIVQYGVRRGDSSFAMQLNVHWLQQHPDGGMVTAREEEANSNEGSLAYHLLVQLRSGQVPVYSQSEDSIPWELVEETAVLSPDLQYDVTLLADPKAVLKTPSRRNGHQSLHCKTPSDNKRLKTEQGQNLEQAPARSPGKVLDDCQGENVLEVAMKAYSPTLDKMAPPQGLFAPTDKELLRFAKKELPFTGPRIDMLFTNGGYLPVTPMGQALIENFERHRNSVILFGKSGCGKTTAIFDAAQRYPCLLFTASSEKADRQKRADPGAKDRSFEALVADVTGLLDDPNVTH